MIFGYSQGCPLTLRVPLRTLFLKSAAHLHLKYRLPGRSLPFRNFAVPKIQIRMESRSGSAEKTKSNPIAGKIQELVNNSTSTDGWDNCWEQGLTPWDLGYPTPVILHLLQTGALPRGRVLVPGCGSGYDVVALASPERYVVGLDISENAFKKGREADFFTWNPTELFDLIFDYTFFCAIEPCKRLAWAKRVRELLKPDGELITLMFPIGVHAGGPPYTVSVADYKEVLHPMGFEAVFVEDNNLAIKPRKGREKLGRWKRVVNKSLL